MEPFKNDNKAEEGPGETEEGALPENNGGRRLITNIIVLFMNWIIKSVLPKPYCQFIMKFV